MKAKLLIPLFALLIGCNSANKPLTEAQKDDVKKEAANVIKDFYNSMMTNDSAKLMAIMTSEPDVTIIGPGGISTTSDIKKMARQFFAVAEKQTFDTKYENYIVLDPTSFIYTWNGKNAVIMKKGDPMVYDDYMGSYLFKKTGGTWKCIYTHESSKMPEVSDPMKTFTKIEEDWNTANFKNDTSALSQLFAKEYTDIDIMGTVTDRTQDLKIASSGRYKLLTMPVLSDLKVKLYGNVAIVNGVNEAKGTFDGKDMSGKARFTDVFLYRDGRWQCVNTQGVRIKQ